MAAEPSPICAEARALLVLAWPLILANLAQSAIYATDVILLGRLSADALAAGALAVNLYNAFMIFGMGLAAAAAPMIAAERGARAHSVRDIRRTFRQACWAAATICLPSWAILWNAESLLLAMRQDPALANEAAKFIRVTMWGLLPYVLFVVLRNTVSALERPGWVLAALAATLVFNGVLAWALIFGRLGLPALGLTGAGIASAIANLFLLLFLGLVVMRDRRFRRYALFGRWWRPDWERYRAVWALGLPIAAIWLLEIGVFNAAVFVMGIIGKASLAAHAIAIQVAALAFMIPLGIAQAATVRVGYWRGAGDRAGVGRAGWLALAMGTGIMVLTGLLMITVPRPLIRVFIDTAAPANAEVVGLAVSFLAVAALFQVVDGAQAVGAGILRGLEDTRWPLIFAAVGYWVIGIGIGLLLAFPLGLAGVGLWLGLASGLAVVAVLMVARWSRRERLGLV